MLTDHEYACQVTNSDDIADGLISEIRIFVEDQVRSDPDHPAIDNMLDQPPAGLISNIKTKTRWTRDQGEISLLRHRGRIVGISCVEHGEIHSNVSIGGIRCWLDREHRSARLMSRYLLQSNLKWSRLQGKHGMLLTFNGYNKWIYDAICRACNGRAAGIGKVWSKWWKDCIPLPVPIRVKYTDQWCVIKPIDSASVKNAIKEILG